MNTSTKHLLITLAAATLLVATVVSAQAHFPWINMEDSNLVSGRNLKWTVGWGHRFPCPA